MKKIILTVAAVFALTFANAQDKKESSEGFSKGDLYLSGTANYSSATQGNAKTSGFTLSPGLGYFLTENIALEGNLNITSGTSNTGAGPDSKNTGFGIAAGVKYFWTPASKFSLSVGGKISYDSNKTDDGVNPSTTGKTIGLNVPVGLNYFVSSNFALTSTWGGLGYSSNDNGGNGAPKTDKISLGLDMSSVSFGLLYKL